MSEKLPNGTILESCDVQQSQLLNQLLEDHDKFLSTKVEYFVGTNGDVHIEPIDLSATEEDIESYKQAARDLFKKFKSQ